MHLSSEMTGHQTSWKDQDGGLRCLAAEATGRYSPCLPPLPSQFHAFHLGEVVRQVAGGDDEPHQTGEEEGQGACQGRSEAEEWNPGLRRDG